MTLPYTYADPDQETVIEQVPVPQDLEEINQQPTAPLALSVRHDGPMGVHVLPARAGAEFTEIVPTATNPNGGFPVQLSGADMRRSRMVIISTDKPFFVGRSVSMVQKGNATLWPANVPCEIRHADPVYVLCSSAVATDTATLGVRVETWAD